MGNIESTQRTTNSNGIEEVTFNGGGKGSDADAVSAVGLAVAAAGPLWKLCRPSCTGGKTMKAPGKDQRIFRSDFESDPSIRS